LTDARDLNQLKSLADLGLANPYKKGEAIGPNDCTPNAMNQFFTPSGVQITGQALVNLGVACGNDADPSRPFVGFGTLEFLETQANSSYHAFQASIRRTLGSLIVNAAYTYSHSIDDSSDRGDSRFVDSYNLASNRASSNFDQRHNLNISYVYDLPFFSKSTGLAKTLAGGWEWSGITTFQSGTPINISNGVVGDSAGVGNGVGTGSRPDLAGNPHAAACQASQAPGPYLFNPCAFAPPQGLTFGDIGRNTLNLPHRTQFDMGLFKRFRIREDMSFEFRIESFNTFNHTQFSSVNTTFDSLIVPGTPNSSSFLTAKAAHLPRILQLGLKFVF
jgi:hypothetical protein